MISRELIDFLITSGYNAALDAGKVIMDIYNTTDKFDIDVNSNNTIVTIADREANEAIKESLAKTRVPIMSEEGRNILFEERYSWELYWLVDPLDGTIEFVRRVDGEFVVSIALMHDNRPLFGVIYIPTDDTIYFSDPDRGVFKVTEASTKERANTIQGLFKVCKKIGRREYGAASTPTRVVITRSHMNTRTEEILESIREQYGEIELIHCGSSRKMCMLIEGQADIYFRTTPLSDWDIAAGEALVSALGMKVAHLDDKEIKYNKSELIIEPFFATIKEFNHI